MEEYKQKIKDNQELVAIFVVFSILAVIAVFSGIDGDLDNEIEENNNAPGTPEFDDLEDFEEETETEPSSFSETETQPHI